MAEALVEINPGPCPWCGLPMFPGTYLQVHTNAGRVWETLTAKCTSNDCRKLHYRPRRVVAEEPKSG